MHTAIALLDVFAMVHNETSTGVMNDIKEISNMMKSYPDIYLLVDKKEYNFCLSVIKKRTGDHISSILYPNYDL